MGVRVRNLSPSTAHRFPEGTTSWRGAERRDALKDYLIIRGLRVSCVLLDPLETSLKAYDLEKSLTG